MRVAYVCEGGGRIGWGHVGRGRAFTEGTQGAVILLGQGFDEIARWCVDHDVRLPLRAWAAAGMPFSPDAVEYEAVVVDHYTLDAAWIEAVARRTPVLVVDDWMRRELVATALVNSNLGATRADYPLVQVREWLLGPDYALIRSEIRRATGAAHQPGAARRVLVTLGGSDPDGRTAEIVEALTNTHWYRGGGEITAVLGPSYASRAPWEGWPPARCRRLDVVRQPKDFVRRIAEADLVVSGASTTTYELALLGRAFVPVSLVDNQERVGAAWAAVNVGPGVSVRSSGWLATLTSAVEVLVADGGARAALAVRAQAHVDGRGAERLWSACADLAARHSVRAMA